ncbi:MAG TPA: hypothetical protein PKV73_19330 [Agriterribacter sp.]|nr:hypothetical protein [Agriterribacter sp.]
MKYCTFILLILMCNGSFSQNAFNDAWSMRKMISADGVLIAGDSESVAILKRIGSFYRINSESANPFLAPYIEGAGFSVEGLTDIKAKPGNFLSGLNVTKYANALASLMIDRAKQELTIAFFNRFKKFVDENPEAGILFPKTTDNLVNLLSYKYPEMLPALRVSFFEDVSRIAYTLDDVLALPRYEQLLVKVPEVKIVLRSLRLVQELVGGTMHPADAFSAFSAFPEWKDSSLINWGSSVRLANIFSQSLRKVDALTVENDLVTFKFNATHAWVSTKEIRELIEDTIAFRIYLGLIYQLAEKEDIYWRMKNGTVRFTSLMDRFVNHPVVMENKISGFVNLAGQTTNAYKELKLKQDGSITLTKDDYYNYVNLSLDILEYGFGIARNLKDSFSLPEYDYIKTLRKVNNLFRHTYKEAYTQVVNDAVGILADIREKTKTQRGETDTGNKKISLVIPKIAKYGTFMANVADAKTSEDVKAALDNAILPVGSSAIKKYASWNVAVQAYLGAFLRFGSKNIDAGYAWSDRWGVSAPIGIAVSHGFEKWGSLSLFASLIDLGAIVDYQLKFDSVINSGGNKVPSIEKDYKIELGQIFSPGTYLVYGFGANIPLSFGLGAQYGPGLSKINIDAGTPVVLNPKWRFNAFLSVDLPFFNLLNSTKKRR